MSESYDRIRSAEGEAGKDYLRKARVRNFFAGAKIKKGYKMLHGDEGMRRERLVGLTTGAMIGSQLAIPSVQQGPGRTEYRRAVVGRWVAYDFHRPEVFPEDAQAGTVRQVTEGRIAALLLDEVRDKDPQDKTPLDLLRPFDMTHIMNYGNFTPEELEDEGLLTTTTHGEAYEAAGLLDGYAVELGYSRLEDTPVFQVTPKGNTLVRLVPDGGVRTNREEELRSFGWAVVLRPNSAEI